MQKLRSTLHTMYISFLLETECARSHANMDRRQHQSSAPWQFEGLLVRKTLGKNVTHHPFTIANQCQYWTSLSDLIIIVMISTKYPLDLLLCSHWVEDGGWRSPGDRTNNWTLAPVRHFNEEQSTEQNIYKYTQH